MKQTAFFILLLIGFIPGYGQDTLYKRSGEVIPAKITEISTSEIKYKRFSMPDGPVFIIGKNEVEKIRFYNGVVDSFVIANSVTTQTVIPDEIPVVMPQPSTPILTGLIESPRGGLYYYNQVRINEKKMLLIASDKNRSWKSKELGQAIAAAGDFRRNQYIAGFGGPIVLIASMIAAGQTAQSNPNAGTTTALVFNGLGVFVASQVISPIFKNKRSKSVRKVMMLFNEQVRAQQTH